MKAVREKQAGCGGSDVRRDEATSLTRSNEPSEGGGEGKNHGVLTGCGS